MRLNILLVDDNPGDARLVVALLDQTRLENVKIIMADRLATAVTLARDHPIDAVLLDLSLPDSHGIQTIRTFRRAAPELPVIVLTGLADRTVGVQALKEVCQDYLVKGQGDGETIARTILHSIERKRLETELLRAQKAYRLLVEASPDAILVCSENGVTLINEAARQLCRDVVQLRGRTFASLVAPHDVARVGALIADVICGTRRSGVVEARLHSCDGRTSDAEIVALAVDHEGARAAEVIIHDLSARQETDRLRTLAASVFDNSAEAMIVTDATMWVRMVNAAFTDVTGYQPEDIIGQTPRLLSSGKHPPEFYAAMWQAIATTGHWRGDIWNRRKNGEIYVQRLTISAVRSRNGAIENYVGVFSDVTEQRQMEDVIRHRAFHDALTGLPNRALLEDRMEQAVTQVSRLTSGLAVLFLDLDGFKAVNDQHGPTASVTNCCDRSRHSSQAACARPIRWPAWGEMSS